MPINAVIWDFDGTLVDTRQKNLNVTKEILERVNGTDASTIPVLQNLEVYERAFRNVMNWRELYLNYYGLSQAQTEEAGKLWTACQFWDKTPTPFYDGIEQVITDLKTLPQGIVSGNTRNNISHVLQNNGLEDYFQSIIGYEEVGLAQKPEPDGILFCLEKLDALKPGLVFFIGDHEVDARCAANTNIYFKNSGLDVNVISIGAFYGNKDGDNGWKVKPDHRVFNSIEILEIIQST